jgi:hypothetical protein
MHGRRHAPETPGKRISAPPLPLCVIAIDALYRSILDALRRNSSGDNCPSQQWGKSRLLLTVRIDAPSYQHLTDNDGRTDCDHSNSAKFHPGGQSNRATCFALVQHDAMAWTLL